MLRGISLFTGAGGMDVGFVNAGVNVVVANELNNDACDSYAANHPDTTLLRGDIATHYDYFRGLKDIDVVFGGPPCQGFSVAGKMDPHDERSKLIWRFLDIVEIVQPQVFVMENVKALGELEKWKEIRQEYLQRTEAMGYYCCYKVLNSADFGVTQNRERVFFVGCKKKFSHSDLFFAYEQRHKKPLTLRELLTSLPPAGEEGNPLTCTAKITLAANPIMRKSPYAGMIFNGMGRPLNLDSVSTTLPASMGGNKTPIIDTVILNDQTADDWVKNYHKGLWEGTTEAEFGPAPDRLRRLTIAEAALIQSFPRNYIFKGSKSAIYTQIGNAVPCKLAEAVAASVIDVCINGVTYDVSEKGDEQLSFL